MSLNRATLDLRHIFSDYRQKSFILIRPEWKNIEELQSHIINLFGLEHYIYLTNEDGILYPAAEKIDLILDCETLVVNKITVDELMAPNPCTKKQKKQKNQEEIDKPQNKSEKSINNFDSKGSDPETNKKFLTLPEKKSKEHISPPRSFLNNRISNKATSANSSTEDEILIQESIQHLHDILDKFKTSTQEISHLNSLDSVDVDAKPKRKRKRVRKRKTQKQNGNDLAVNSSSTSKLRTSSLSLPKKHKDNPPNRQHIRFDSESSIWTETEPSDVEEDYANVKVQKVIDCDYQSSTKLLPKKVHPRINHWSCDTQSYVQFVDSETVLNPPIELSAVASSSTVRILPTPIVIEKKSDTKMFTDDHLPEAEVPTRFKNICEATPNTAGSEANGRSSLEDLRKDIPQLNLPLIESVPKAGTVIAFKLLRMDDQSQPTISDYIIGSVKEVNEDKMELIIELLAGKNEIGSLIQKTVIDEEGFIERVEDTEIELKFSELIQPCECLCFS